MNARTPLQADAEAIGAFVEALFRYADPGTFVSLRAFHDAREAPFFIAAHEIGDSLDSLTEAAALAATRAAQAPEPVVFCPPVATLANPAGAKETDLANGLALSVECDATPQAARERLESLLGRATAVVASGGEWTDPTTGELQPKLHLHWRLTEATRDAAGHAALKRLRQIATRLVGADASNTPLVHPIRWPGSWHRKTAPRLARLIGGDPAAEIALQDALERLTEAATASGIHDHRPTPAAASTPPGEARETADLIRAILTAEDYHAPLASLAMRLLKGGIPDAQAVMLLRGFMLAVPEADRDRKGGGIEPGRWQARFADIPRAVSTARAKVGERPAQDTGPADGWPDPVDFLGDTELTGTPQLRPDHLPDALAPFVFDTAARMGVDPAAVALAAVVACASVASDDWAIQPKVHDDTWTENPRLWGAIVGDPSILKSPVLRATTKPIDALEAEARRRHADAMRKWEGEVAALKADKAPQPYPAPPRCDRYMVEGTTTEALSEVLRDDDKARFRVPAGKVMVRQDELSGWLASMDAYKAGGSGGADRAAYLTLYNGGRYTYDRVARGSFAVPNWSGCVLGGIQPEPIQKIAKDAADDGLLQRFLYVVPATQPDGEDRRPDHAALARYEALFPALAMLRPAIPLTGDKPRPVVLHAEAHHHREAIAALAKAQAAMPDTSSRLKAALGKWPGTFPRLALTFHLIDLADANARGADGPIAAVLLPETARRAASFMRDVLLPHLLRAEGMLFLTRQTGHARWLAGHILASEDARRSGLVTARDLTRAYGALRAPEQRRELEAVMQSLEVVGWVRAEMPDNPARPITTWHVNPKLHAAFGERVTAERARRDAARERTVAAIMHGPRPRP